MEKLFQINLVLKKYDEAATFLWIVAKENMKMLRSYNSDALIDVQRKSKISSFISQSLVYHAYDLVLEYILRPVSSEKYPGHFLHVLNAARAIIGFSTP